MTLLALLALLACPAGAQSAMADKAFGILLLGEGGSKEWKDATDAVGKEMSKKKVPFEFAAGDGDGRSIQKAVDKLQFQRVKKIVAVPLTLSSFSEEMEQDRFLLGVREKPSQEFSGAPHAHNRARGAQERVKARVPVVVTKALDDSDAAVEILAARAKAQSHDPSKEILVLVGKAPGNKEGLKDWVSTVNALAEKVRASGGFRMAQAAALRDDVDRAARDRSESEVRKAVSALHKQGIVIVVPLELTADVVHNRIPHVLEGIQVRYDGKTMLPDPRIVKWVAESAEEGAKLPEMRVFKEGGKGPALSQPSSQLDKTSQLGGGSQLNTGSQFKNGGN